MAQINNKPGFRFSRPRVCATCLVLSLLLAACSTGFDVAEQVEPTTVTRQAIAIRALEQLGAPYQANASGPDAFDDSGLAWFAYRGGNTPLPRNIQAQLDTGKPIELTEAKPADLVFFRVETSGGDDRLRVGLYTQPGTTIIAVPVGLRDKSGVRIIDLDDEFWQQRLVGVIRLLPNKTAP